MQELYILGNGAMAKAMAQALKNDYQLSIVGRSRLKLFEDEGFKTLFYDDFTMDDKNIILAFKPYALEELKDSLKGEANYIISVLVNTPIKSLKLLRARNYASILASTAAAFKASTTPFVLDNAYKREEIISILKAFGEVIELESEAQMGAAGTLAACSPAYLALIAEALMNAGVYNGLNKELTQSLVQGAFKSFSSLVEKEHPAFIKEKICSPAGTTIKGIFELEKAGLRASMIKAVNASINNKN